MGLPDIIIEFSKKAVTAIQNGLFPHWLPSRV